MTIYEKVAAQHNTTPEEVKEEMQKAIRATGIDMEPEVFINLVARGVLNKIEQGREA